MLTFNGTGNHQILWQRTERPCAGAVKCNPDRAMLAMLAAQGTGFDCASAAEIDLVMGLGVPASRIIYAHPCKPMAHMRHAAQAGFMLTASSYLRIVYWLRNCT